MIDEAERIKDRLNDCKTAAEVHLVAGEEREAVRAMHKMEGDGPTLAIHIMNLKQWKLDNFTGFRKLQERRV